MSLAPSTGAEQEGEFRPSDEATRRIIEYELGETLFVEASAGTGKTHSLVARTVNLVAQGMTTLDRIAAITFTEAAASELRHRIREKLEEEADTTQDEARRERCRQGSPTWTRPPFAPFIPSPACCSTNGRWKRACRPDSTPRTR